MISFIPDNSAVLLKLVTSLVLTDDSEAQGEHGKCCDAKANGRCQKTALINMSVMLKHHDQVDLPSIQALLMRRKGMDR